MRVRVDGPAGRREGRRQDHRRNPERPDDQHAHRDVRGERPAPGGRDADGDRTERCDHKRHCAGGRRSGIAGRMAEQQGEKAADENGRACEVAKTRAGKQVDRARAQVCGDEECPDQIPESIQGLAPTKRAAEELRPRADAVEK